MVAPETDMEAPIGDNRNQAAGGESVDTSYTKEITGDEADSLGVINRPKQQQEPGSMIREEGFANMGNHVRRESATSEKAH